MPAVCYIQLDTSPMEQDKPWKSYVKGLGKTKPLGLSADRAEALGRCVAFQRGRPDTVIQEGSVVVSPGAATAPIPGSATPTAGGGTAGGSDWMQKSTIMPGTPDVVVYAGAALLAALVLRR